MDNQQSSDGYAAQSLLTSKRNSMGQLPIGRSVLQSKHDIQRVRANMTVLGLTSQNMTQYQKYLAQKNAVTQSVQKRMQMTSNGQLAPPNGGQISAYLLDRASTSLGRNDPLNFDNEGKMTLEVQGRNQQNMDFIHQNQLHLQSGYFDERNMSHQPMTQSREQIFDSNRINQIFVDTRMAHSGARAADLQSAMTINPRLSKYRGDVLAPGSRQIGQQGMQTHKTTMSSKRISMPGKQLSRGAAMMRDINFGSTETASRSMKSLSNKRETNNYKPGEFKQVSKISQQIDERIVSFANGRSNFLQRNQITSKASDPNIVVTLPANLSNDDNQSGPIEGIRIVNATESQRMLPNIRSNHSNLLTSGSVRSFGSKNTTGKHTTSAIVKDATRGFYRAYEDNPDEQFDLTDGRIKHQGRLLTSQTAAMAESEYHSKNHDLEAKNRVFYNTKGIESGRMTQIMSATKSKKAKLNGSKNSTTYGQIPYKKGQLIKEVMNYSHAGESVNTSKKQTASTFMSKKQKALKTVGIAKNIVINDQYKEQIIPESHRKSQFNFDKKLSRQPSNLKNYYRLKNKRSKMDSPGSDIEVIDQKEEAHLKSIVSPGKTRFLKNGVSIEISPADSHRSPASQKKGASRTQQAELQIKANRSGEQLFNIVKPNYQSRSKSKDKQNRSISQKRNPRSKEGIFKQESTTESELRQQLERNSPNKVNAYRQIRNRQSPGFSTSARHVPTKDLSRIIKTDSGDNRLLNINTNGHTRSQNRLQFSSPPNVIGREKASTFSSKKEQHSPVSIERKRTSQVINSQTFNEIQVQDEADQKPLIITEDGQVQQCDSDDEYENYRRLQHKDPREFLDMQKQTQMLQQLALQKSRQHLRMSNTSRERIVQFIDEDAIDKQETKEALDYLQKFTVSNMPDYMQEGYGERQKKNRRSSSLLEHLGQHNPGESAIEYALPDKQSKFVKFSNKNINVVLDVMKFKEHLEKLRDQGANLDDPEVNAETLLRQTNVSIKNMNHALLKLVAVQQESISIQKQSVQEFELLDRVPVYLEIGANGMPYPAKFTIRPNFKKTNINREVINEIIAQHCVIYLSTKTKNPSAKNNQLKLEPPAPRVFSFGPLIDQGTKAGGKKDIFDKIFVCLEYDLSNFKAENIKMALGGRDIGNQCTADTLQQVAMQILVTFPKDKEEIQKKKMEAMLAKLGKRSGTGDPENNVKMIDVTAKSGVKRIQQINQELTEFYDKERKNKPQNHTTVNSARRDAQQSSFDMQQPGEMSYSNTNAASHTDLRRINSRTQSAFGQSVYPAERQSVAYNLSNEHSPEQVRQMYGSHYNQLIDLQSVQHLRGNMLQQDSIDDMLSGGMGGVKKLTDQMNNLGPVDHIARNAYISSQYRQMQNIRSQLNNDLMYTRLYNSQIRVQKYEEERRMKGEQWLSKWDNYRAIKNEYVEFALQILKQRRKISNIIILMQLNTIVKALCQNVYKKREYNKRQFSKFLVNLRLQVHFKLRYKQRYGPDFDHRHRQVIRRSFTLQHLFNTEATDYQAKAVLKHLFCDYKERLMIDQKFKNYKEQVLKIEMMMFKTIQQRKAILELVAMRVCRRATTHLAHKPAKKGKTKKGSHGHKETTHKRHDSINSDLQVDQSEHPMFSEVEVRDKINNIVLSYHKLNYEIEREKQLIEVYETIQQKKDQLELDNAPEQELQQVLDIQMAMHKDIRSTKQVLEDIREKFKNEPDLVWVKPTAEGDEAAQLQIPHADSGKIHSGRGHVGEAPDAHPQPHGGSKKKNHKKETKSGEPKPIVLEAKLLLSFAQTEYQDVQRIFRVLSKVREVQIENKDAQDSS